MHSEEPLVTVVIPAHNAERTLARTVESVLDQTHSQLEVLIVDDGSRDGTAALAESYARRDSRVRLLKQQNGGVARARNRGLYAATAEFVAPVDADDLWHRTKIEKQLAIMMNASDDTAFVYSPCRVIDADDRVIGSAFNYGVRGWVTSRMMFVNFVGNGSALLLRKSVAIGVGGYDPSLRDRGIEGSEDYKLQLRMAYRRPVEVANEYLVGYRRIPGTMSSDVAKMARSEFEVRRTLRNECQGIPDAAFRWGAGTRLADYALQSMRRGQFLQAGRMLSDGLRLDPLGAMTHFVTQAWARGNETINRVVRIPTGYFGIRQSSDSRSFWDYDPNEEMVPEPWLLRRRLEMLAADEPEVVSEIGATPNEPRVIGLSPESASHTNGYAGALFERSE